MAKRVILASLEKLDAQDPQDRLESLEGMVQMDPMVCQDLTE